MALKELPERNRRSSSQFPEDFIFQLLPKRPRNALLWGRKLRLQVERQRKLPNVLYGKRSFNWWNKNKKIMIIGAAVFFLLTLLFYFFPPKKINSFYGYRTFASKRNPKNWETANKISSRALLVVSSIMLLEAILFSIYFDKSFERIILITLILGLAITFFITERRIRRV